MWSESLCQRVAQRANYIRPYSAVSLPHRKSPFLPRLSFSLARLFLFPDGIAEVPQLSAQGEVFPVGVCHETTLLEIQLALAVQKAFVHIHAGDLCLKDGVCPQFFRVGDTALQADGTLGDHRRTYGLRLLWGEVALGELVHVSAAAHAAEIRGFHHGGGGEIDDELAGFPDEVVGIPGGSDGNIGHGRMGRQNACPGDGEDVGMLHRAAGDQGRRYGC